MCMGTLKERQMWGGGFWGQEQEAVLQTSHKQEQKRGGNPGPSSQPSALATTFHPSQPEVLSFPCHPFQTFLEDWRDTAQRVL